jgi:hypothetical protein
MKTSKPKIVWEKWKDPFGRDIDEQKWTDYSDELQHFHQDAIKKEEDDDAYNNDESMKIPIPQNPIKVISSPLGLIPYTEHTASSKIFNFWLGHTNFNISENVKNTIESVEGVEILDVFTRYRFRIAVGKCFGDSEVLNLINKSVQKLFNNQNGNKQ